MRGKRAQVCCVVAQRWDLHFEFFVFRVLVEKTPKSFLPPKNTRHTKNKGKKNEERQQRGTARLLLLFALRSFSVHFSFCIIFLFLFLFLFFLFFSRAEKEGRNTRAKRTAPLVPVRSFLVLDIIVGRRSKSRRRCPRRGAAAREFILARAELVRERVSQR